MGLGKINTYDELLLIQLLTKFLFEIKAGIFAVLIYVPMGDIANAIRI